MQIVTAINAPIVPDPFLIGVMVYEEMMERQRQQAPLLLEKAAEQVRQASHLTVTTKVLQGSPKDEIVEEAERWGADLIVLGSHGYGTVKRFVLGSVSHAVAMHAPCSVEIVRCREETAATEKPEPA